MAKKSSFTSRNRDNKKPFKDVIGSGERDNANTMPPIFSLEKMRENTGYCISNCQEADLAALVKKMFVLSKMKWQEIQNAPRHGLGPEIISRDSFKIAVRNDISDDVNLIAIRYSGKKPIVGYRDERIFYILYIDHNFTLYQHQ